MHRKIVLIDDKIALLGSMNLTYASLAIHDNLLVALYSFRLVDYLKRIHQDPSQERFFRDSIDRLHLQFWPLPKEGPLALSELKRAIDEARFSIDLALFSFTQKGIGESLLNALKRGVRVRLFIDRKASLGSSKKMVNQLQRAGLPISIQRHQGLLHHKIGFIDKKILFFGSANWSDSAFYKNMDYLTKMSPLPPLLSRRLEKLFYQLDHASIPIKEA